MILLFWNVAESWELITEWKVERGLSSCFHFSHFLTFALKHNPFLQLTSTSPNKSRCRCWICKWKVLLKPGGNIRHFASSAAVTPHLHSTTSGSSINHSLKITSLSPTEAIHQAIFQLVDIRSSFQYFWYQGTKDSTAGHYFSGSSDC